LKIGAINLIGSIYYRWIIRYSNQTDSASPINKYTQWQAKAENQEKLKLLHQRQFQSHQEQDFSSLSAESEDFLDTLTTLRELVLVHLFTWQLCLNIWLLKFWNWLETLPRTTKRPELCQDTFFWPLEMIRNSISCCTTLLLLKEVSSLMLLVPSPETSNPVVKVLKPCE